jgi:trk system potassium uptake protein TrkA
VICIYRGDEFALPNADFALKSGDEIVLITHMRNLPALTKRWSVANSTTGAE